MSDLKTGKGTYGYNLSSDFLKVQGAIHEHVEKEIHQRIHELTVLNEQNHDLQKLIASLTHAKKDKKADFRNDEEIKHVIDSIREFAPSVLGHVPNRDKLYVWGTEEDIESALQALDGQVRIQMNLVSSATMYINQNYEDRIHYTEIALKTLEMMTRHIESIISKYNKH